MSISRRTFVKSASAAAALSAIGTRADALAAPSSIFVPEHASIADFRGLAMKALDAAKAAGAEYVDVRIAQYRSQTVQTRERRVQGLADTETAGIGVRTLVNGAWGFAATADLSADSVTAVARKAVAQAKANRVALTKPIVLAPYGTPQKGTWRSPIKTDPFSIPIADKVALLLAANEAALKVKGVRFATSGVNFLREEKTFANSEGSFTEQTLFRCSPNLNITAVSEDNSDFQSRAANEIPPRGLGYEHLVDSKLVENAPRWADEAVQKLAAKPVEVGRYDLVLHPTHLWLTIHESVAHPTELDRALGFEANYAGTSFVSPPEKVLGTLQYGPAIMNVVGNRTELGGCSTCGWDDEGVPAQSWPIIDKGIFVNYQTTREMASWISNLTKVTGSLGTAYGQDWASIPFPRMPNVSLMPNPQDLGEEDIISATKRGIYIEGD